MAITYEKFNDKNIAPYLSNMIVIKNSKKKIIGKIPIDNYKPEYGERLYRFAVLSDIHFNESDTSVKDSNNMLPIDDAILDFKRAIKFISTKPENDIDNIEFACICGDLQSYYGGYILDELDQYKSAVAELGKEVYTCTGNHDTNYTYDWEDESFSSYKAKWAETTGMSSDRRDHFTKTHTTSEGIEVKDNFYFLSMRKFNMGTQGKMFKDEDIDDLETYLEEHKNERTFIFVHTPFPMRSGLFAYKYNTGDYWLGGKWLKRLSDLSYKYKNTLWLSGHSHYEWNCQGVEKSDMTFNNVSVYNFKEKNYDANIWPVNQDHNREVGWSLHIPSCSGVRPIGNAFGTEDWKVYNTSEFAIIDVYENYIDFRGVSLIGQDRTEDSGKLYYNPVAQYRLDTTILSEDTKSYNLSSLSVTDIQNMSIDDVIDICLTSTSYSSYHVGSINDEYKFAAIYNSFGSSPVCGSNINYDLSNIDETNGTYLKHYNSECQLFAEMRDLVNMRPKQFIFKLYKDENGYCILNSSNKGININSDSSVSFEDSHTYFNIVGNNSEYTSTSCLVSQINNDKLIRLQDINTNKYIKINNNYFNLISGDDGWTLMYIYKIERT